MAYFEADFDIDRLHYSDTADLRSDGLAANGNYVRLTTGNIFTNDQFDNLP